MLAAEYHLPLCIKMPRVRADMCAGLLLSRVGRFCSHRVCLRKSPALGSSDMGTGGGEEEDGWAEEMRGIFREREGSLVDGNARSRPGRGRDRCHTTLLGVKMSKDAVCCAALPPAGDTPLGVIRGSVSGCPDRPRELTRAWRVASRVRAVE